MQRGAGGVGNDYIPVLHNATPHLKHMHTHTHTHTPVMRCSSRSPPRPGQASCCNATLMKILTRKARTVIYVVGNVITARASTLARIFSAQILRWLQGVSFVHSSRHNATLGNLTFWLYLYVIRVGSLAKILATDACDEESLQELHPQ